MSGALLTLRGVEKSFGAVRSLAGIDLTLEPHTIVGLIGPNGAGKSTLINILTGVYRPDRGSVIFADENLAGISTADRARRGLARTFQRPTPIGDLPVIDGVMVGGLVRGLSRARARGAAMEILVRLGLQTEARKFPQTLPAARLRLVDLARALMLKPKLVLLDELMAGVFGVELDNVLTLIEMLANDGMSFLVVEHRMDVIQKLSRVLVVMDAGSVIAYGPPDQVVREPRVIEAYLGLPQVAEPC